MSTLRNPMWDSSNNATTMELPVTAKSGMNALHNKLDLVWATIAVLGAQVVIRVMMLMRQLNY